MEIVLAWRKCGSQHNGSDYKTGPGKQFLKMERYSGQLPHRSFEFLLYKEPRALFQGKCCVRFQSSGSKAGSSPPLKAEGDFGLAWKAK